MFGEWPTIYPALSELPSAARESWFAFDHFYSDNAFQLALKTIFDLEPKHIYDIGANTGKWALQCAAHDPDVKITLLDLPQQIALANENVKSKGYSDRISSYPVDLLLADKLPRGSGCLVDEPISRLFQRGKNCTYSKAYSPRDETR